MELDSSPLANAKINNHSLKIAQDEKTYGYAGKIWDCAYVFSNFISSEKVRKLLKNKAILEVGSGTGLCGLIAACAESKKVYLTDRIENLNILQKNFELNKDSLNSEVCITDLNWNYIVDFKKITEGIDIIIASDIIYHGVNYESIINLFDYFSTTKTDILLAYNDRISSSLQFFDILEEGGKWVIKRLKTEIIEEEDFSNERIIILLIKKLF